MTKPLRKPTIRIDGGRRRDLDKKRIAARMAGVTANAPTPDEIKAAEKRRFSQIATIERHTRRLIALDGGKDGAEVSVVKVRDLQGQRARTLTRNIRARPGTFDWRYGRDTQSALYHAGSHFARLWERAGISVASSANFLRGTSSGYATGISDGRAMAMGELRGLVQELGLRPSERMIAYCVEGRTSTDLARQHAVPDRDMAAVLHQDLRAVAMHFRFL